MKDIEFAEFEPVYKVLKAVDPAHRRRIVKAVMALLQSERSPK